MPACLCQKSTSADRIYLRFLRFLLFVAFFAFFALVLVFADLDARGLRVFGESVGGERFCGVNSFIGCFSMPLP
jgi:hypothetical protein